MLPSCGSACSSVATQHSLVESVESVDKIQGQGARGHLSLQFTEASLQAWDLFRSATAEPPSRRAALELSLASDLPSLRRLWPSAFATRRTWPLRNTKQTKQIISRRQASAQLRPCTGSESTQMRSGYFPSDPAHKTQRSGVKNRFKADAFRSFFSSSIFFSSCACFSEFCLV